MKITGRTSKQTKDIKIRSPPLYLTSYIMALFQRKEAENKLQFKPLKTGIGTNERLIPHRPVNTIRLDKLHGYTVQQ